MPSNGLIVIVRVRPECQDRLRTILNQIGNDINGKRLTGIDRQPHIDFPSSRTIHFARLVLLADPDRGPDRYRLLLVTDFEGTWLNHVRELHSITSDPEAIWGCCEGYSDFSSFTRFIRRHEVKPQAYYIAFHGLSLKKIRTLAKSLAQSAPPPVKKPDFSLPDIAIQGLESLLRLPLIGLSVGGIVLRRGPLRTLRAARRVNATQDRIWWIYIFNRLALNSFPPPAHRYSSIPIDTTADCEPASGLDEVSSKKDWEGAPAEDLVAQNQLTLVTVVDPERLPQLQAVLEVIELYARRLAEEGSLVGIRTIHTVRWALLDGGKRLLLASNYDGTWENYIDEFAELILSGLDAIWESSYGFPELGAQDVAAFKHFLRCHQAPASVFYSAYPKTTIPNILDGLQLERMRSARV
jgi:hypothetical protein